MSYLEHINSNSNKRENQISGKMNIWIALKEKKREGFGSAFQGIDAREGLQNYASNGIVSGHKGRSQPTGQ